MVKDLNNFWDWVQIDRKLVKQTVMTSVYGVTFIGARMQISNRLKERGPIASNPVDTYRAACYAAKVPFKLMFLCVLYNLPLVLMMQFPEWLVGSTKKSLKC